MEGKVIMKQIIELLLKLFWIFPIKKNRVVFRSSQGTRYNCNPKYISEYLQSKYPNKFEIIWIFENASKYSFLKNSGIIVCNQKSIRGLFYIITAKFLIDNHGVQSYIPIRKKQEVINTWHGGGSYKKPYINHDKKHIKYVKKMNERTTRFVSSCHRFSINNLKRIYDEVPEKIMEIGMPRNDIFWQDRPDVIKKVKSNFEIPENRKIILYTPTFRDDWKDEEYEIDFKKIIQICNSKFKRKFYICDEIT